MTYLFDIVHALRAPDGQPVEIRRRSLEDDAPKFRAYPWLWGDSERMST